MQSFWRSKKSLVFYIYMNIFSLLEFLKMITGIVFNFFPIFIAYLLVINVKFVAERVSLHCADTATLRLKGRNSTCGDGMETKLDDLP